MMQVLAMHGWAGQAGTWSHWRQHFEKGGARWSSGDRGYSGGEAVAPAWPPGPERNMLIAHSLGLHLLPAAVLAQADAVVLLGSFSAFVPHGRTGRAVLAALKGMQTALGTDQELTMLEHFLAKAASPHARSALPPAHLLQGLTSLGRQRLQKDLKLLAHCQSLPTGWPEAVPVLVVQGEQDAVVHAASAQQLIDDLGQQPLTLHRDPNWGHALITPPVLSVVEQWLGAL